MINARPHIKGNTREHFEDAYNALVEAMRKVQDARDVLSDNVLNGRNYQHVADSKLGMADRARAKDDFRRIIDLLFGLAGDVADALQNRGA